MNQQTESNERISDAVCVLLAHRPEIGFILLQFDFIPTTSIHVMGVRLNNNSTRITCYYNPTTIDQLTTEEIVAVLQHEVAHIMQCHCQRIAGRDPKRWNIACDMVVNGRQSSPRIGLQTTSETPPIIPFADRLVWIPECVDEDGTAEEYYDFLADHRNAFVFANLGDRFFLDDHSPWDNDSIVTADAEVIVNTLQNQQMKYVRGWSRVGIETLGEGREIAIEPGESKSVPWNVLLRRQLYSSTKPRSRSLSYMKKNRRRPVFGLPGNRRLQKHVVNVAIDVSGSVDSMLLGLFFSEIERVSENSTINLLLWDTTHRGFYPNFDVTQWKSHVFRGGGGTDMEAALTWLEDNDHVRDLVVLFTDGEVMGWKKKSPWQLVTVIFGDMPGPDWGTTIYIDR